MRYSIQGCLRYGCLTAAVVGALLPVARASEHVTLKNGFEVDCVRREVVGDKVRLYLTGAGNYMDVAADALVRVETVADAPVAAVAVAEPAMTPVSDSAKLTTLEMHTMLAHAGTAHNIDEDLLASLVKAESGGQVHAVSRTGARGLMQLMPETANELGSGAGGVQRRSPRGGQVSRHSAVSRDAGIRGAGDP
jgi:hypothetical protein